MTALLCPLNVNTMKVCIIILSFIGAIICGYLCIDSVSGLESTNQWLIFLMIMTLFTIFLVGIWYNFDCLKGFKSIFKKR